MTKSDLISAAAATTGSSKVKISAILDTVLGKIAEAVVRDEKAHITRFGTFYRYNRSARRGVNPRTGEPIQIPSIDAVAFRASRILRDAIQ